METEKVTTMVRFEQDLKRELETIARIEKRSLNQQIAHFLTRQVQNWNLKQDKIKEYERDYEKVEGKNED